MKKGFRGSHLLYRVSIWKISTLYIAFPIYNIEKVNFVLKEDTLNEYFLPS